jgi:hypothetical protein
MDLPMWLIGLVAVYTATFLGVLLSSRGVTEFVDDDVPSVTSPYHAAQGDATTGSCPRCGTKTHSEYVYCQSCLASVESETTALTDDANAT